MNIWFAIIIFIYFCFVYAYVEYMFHELLYKKPLTIIIKERKERLLKIKSKKEFQIFKLESKNENRYKFRITKLRKVISIISTNLKQLEDLEQKL